MASFKLTYTPTDPANENFTLSINAMSAYDHIKAAKLLVQVLLYVPRFQGMVHLFLPRIIHDLNLVKQVYGKPSGEGSQGQPPQDDARGAGPGQRSGEPLLPQAQVAEGEGKEEGRPPAGEEESPTSLGPP